MPILIDFSQLTIASAMAFHDDMKKGQDTKKMQDIIRHVTLKSFVSYKQKHQQEFGSLVLCADGSKNWRRGVFQYYKASRAKNRQESDTDWASIFSFQKDLIEDLREVFPYPLVRVEEAEGDDVIACLTEWYQNNRTIAVGLDEEPEPTLIVSNDGDFKQLHKYHKVKQWNPLHKKWVERPESDFLIEKIITGDEGDGVPSVLMQDDFLIEKATRAKPVTQKVKERFKLQTDLDAEEKRRFERNRQLIDFSYIPADVKQKIIDQYITCEPKRDMNKIMNYLIKHRCRELLTNIQMF